MSMSAHAYRTTRKPGRSDATRERIKAAVRELLAEGTFHTSRVEHVAERAGISRATLYQHFRSRLELVDAICETFDANPALLELRQIVELPDAEAALDKTIGNSIRFWSSEDAVLHQLYSVAAIDPAALSGSVTRRRTDERRIAPVVSMAGRSRCANRVNRTSCVIARLVIEANPLSSSSAAWVAPTTVRCSLFLESLASRFWAATHP